LGIINYCVLLNYKYFYRKNNIKIFIRDVTNNRNGTDIPRHAFDKYIPFEFEVKIPPPLKSGVDYGFRPSKKKI